MPDQVLDPVVINSDNSQPLAAPSGASGGMTLAPPVDQPETPAMTLATDDGPSPPSAALTDKRVSQIQYGLGDVLKKPTPEIQQAVSQGQEPQLRDQAAADMDYKNAMAKQQAILDLAIKQKGPVTVDQYNQIMDPFHPTNQPVDPKDVVERAWAHKFNTVLDTASQYMESSTWDQAKQEIPEVASALQNKQTALTSKMMIARNLQDDLEDEIHNQSWGGWIADQAKNLFQPYVEAKLRGNNPNVGWLSGGLLLGTNLKEQADNLFSTTTVDQFRTRLHDIASNIRKDNPTLAKQFVDYVVGKSSSDEVLDNTFTVLMPFDYYGVAEGGLNLARKISLNNRAATLMKDMTKAAAEAQTPAAKNIPTEAIAAEAKGDVNQAAIIRAADEADKKLSGTAEDITDRIKDKFFTFFRGMSDDVQTNVGTASREQYTRLSDGFMNTANGLWDSLKGALRVIRTPNALVDEDALKAYKEASKGNFKGIHGELSDIGNPVWEPVTNTHWVPHYFVDVDGGLFKTGEQAGAKAELNGFKDVKIQETNGPVVTKPSYLVGSKRDLMRKPQIEDTLAKTPDLISKYKKQIAEATDPAIAKGLKAEVTSINRLQKQAQAELDTINGRLTRMPATVEQNGAGYHYVVWKPYKETDSIVRSWLISHGAGGDIVKNAVSPLTYEKESASGVIKASINWFRGADDTLALYDTLQRKTATYAQNKFNEMMRNEAKKIEAVYTGNIPVDAITGEKIPWFQAKARQYLGKLSNRQTADQFSQVLDYARKAQNPVTERQGYFFKTVGDLEAHYQTAFQRLPTPQETEAYFTHVKLVEMNRVFSEISEFRYRARIGSEQHSLYTLAEDGTRVSSNYFDGINQKEFPGGKGQILIMGDKSGEEKLANIGRINTKSLEKLRQGVQEGTLKVIRIYNPDEHPLRDFSEVAGDNRVRYVITKNVDSKPLDFNHVNRLEGGHFEYDYPWYIKQARMKHDEEGPNDFRTRHTSWYTGDTTIMPIGNRSMGNKIIKHLEQVRTLIKNGDFNAAQQYTEQHLPIKWDGEDGINSWFKAGRDEKGRIINPRLDVNEPIHLVPKDKNIRDVDKSLEDRYSGTFEDAAKSGSDAQQFRVAFNQQRDVDNLHTIVDKGTRNNPLYDWVPADMVDPLPTMARSLQRAIGSTFMDDYKIMSVEHWLQEAAPLLKTKRTQLEASPFYHFETTATKAEFKAGVSDLQIKNLLENRMKIKQFTGIQSDYDKFVHGISQNLADKFYEAYGPEEGRQGLEKLTMLPMWMLAESKSPVQILRSFTFNSKLGMFNPVQMLVQANAHANIWAIEPRHGTAGTWAQALHQVSRVNSSPAMLDFLDNLATKLNVLGVKFKPGEWKEARQLLDENSFNRVGQEHSIRPDQMEYRFFKNDWKNFQDAGQVFFREGEAAPRLSAFYTSYKKFRTENPTGAISQLDKQKILNYADLLNNNMSRASQSNMHTGAFSLSSQFLTYQLRSLELFTGKRLAETTFERNMARARLVMTYGAMYGIPSGIGVSGFPFGDMIRQHAMDNWGYVPGDHWYSTALMEGLPALMLHAITGNSYNVGPRFGSQGLTTFADLFKSDTTFWKIVGGAGGSVGWNTLTSVLDPFWKKAQSLISPDEQGNHYPITADDFVNMFNEVSSVQQARKLMYALNTGRWVSNNGAYMNDTSRLNAIFQAVTGMQSQDQSDNYLRSQIMKGDEDNVKRVMKDTTKDYNRYLDAIENKDRDIEEMYGKRIRTRFALEGINQEQQTKLLAIAGKGRTTPDLIPGQIGQSWSDFATKNVPVGKEKIRQDAYQRWLQTQKKQ